MKPTKRVKQKESFAAGVGRGLRLAAKAAHKTARMYGTPIYVSEGGKVVAKKARNGTSRDRHTTREQPDFI
jgi:hypothetical protein